MLTPMLKPWLTPPDASTLPWLAVCPFAGASGGAFRHWQNLDDSGMAISLAVYPGRDQRMRESPHVSIDALAAELADDIAQRHAHDCHRLLLLGHSMGAQVAFETCRRLETRGVAPAGLVLSGCHAPQLSGRRRLCHLADQPFIDALVDIGGCDAALRDDPALLAQFLPLLRADFLATESYALFNTQADTQAPPRIIQTRTLLIHGTHDTEASPDEVRAWLPWLARPLGVAAMAGDHFYIPRRPRALLKLLRQTFHLPIPC
ncbi:alpha/beta fold hydrolase [Cupriavidus sp. BIS7]|uniref:thioesterase II family protein n=1 Tax=Cupriavidus sp. BIS7 TaxID=1217718 RepID=UPI0002EA9FF6|nr:alpha/beta fold hydrolase [Cupriavidus sp. BIS7]